MKLLTSSLMTLAVGAGLIGTPASSQAQVGVNVQVGNGGFSVYSGSPYAPYYGPVVAPAPVVVSPSYYPAPVVAPVVVAPRPVVYPRAYYGPYRPHILPRPFAPYRRW